MARGLEATPFACEADRKEALAFTLRSRGAQLADLVSARAAATHEVYGVYVCMCVSVFIYVHLVS